jgi:hypothetical protein
MLVLGSTNAQCHLYCEPDCNRAYSEKSFPDFLTRAVKSLNSTTESETKNSDFQDFFDRLEQVLEVFFVTFFVKNHLHITFPACF